MNYATLESTNPALSNDHAFGAGTHAIADAGRATMAGVINKTAILVTVAMAAGIGGYWLFGQYPGMLWVGSIAALVVSLGVFFAMYAKPALAPVLAPIYAVVEGAFLGGATGLIEMMLQQQGIKVPGGVAFQALVITGAVMVAMLVLYRAGIIKPTNTFVSIISAATMGIMLAYLASFVLSLFGFSLPFLSLGSVTATGTAGLIGLGINVVVLVVAALWLVVDFRRIDELLAAGSPRSMEWYCGFCLLVSLAWIYWESVKLVARLAVLFGRRD